MNLHPNSTPKGAEASKHVTPGKVGTQPQPKRKTGANEQVSREVWRGRTVSERFMALKEIWVGTAHHEKAITLVNNKVAHVQLTGESEGLMVICGSGGGKTTLCRRLKKLNPDEITQERTLLRVVFMKIPKVCTRAGLAKELLRALGDPSWDEGNAEDNLRRSTALVKECGVRILAVDNFQDIPERRSRGSVRVVGNWFRDLFDEITVVLLALGTEQARKVRLANDQVRRRIATVHTIPYFTVDTPAACTEWIKALGEIDRLLPLAEHSNLAAGKLAARLFIASNGIFDYLFKLIRYAISLAVESGRESLTQKDFEDAFDLMVADVTEGGNPFKDDFRGTALNKPNEIFFKLEKAGRDGVDDGGGDDDDDDDEDAPGKRAPKAAH